MFGAPSKDAKGDTQGRMHGFQLWANLPSSLKMTDSRYQHR
jgi:redox-sensitive bicupin YhaK (pirin superfamily)